MPERPPEVELTPQDVERLRRVRVSKDGNVKMESEVVLEEATNRRLRYNALLDWNRKQLETAQALIDGSERAFQLDMRQTAESQAASDAGWEKYAGGKGQTALNKVKALADLERRREIARRNEEVALTIKNEERLADLWQAEAERQARINKEAARKAQRLADESRARSEAARIAFEKGIEALKAKEAVKSEITRKLVSDALSSNAPLIAPGLLMVDIDRLPIAIERNVVVTDTVNKPNVTTRQSVVYLRNWAGFEAQTQAFQQSFFHYLHSDQAGRGMAIAGEAFRGPMAAQQGINLVNSRLWVTEGGARLLKEYRNADKAAGRDLVTYKVYSATGMLVKQTQDSVDALRAIEEIERERMLRMTKPSPLTAAGVGEAMTTLTEAASMNPPEPRRTTVPLKKQRLERIRGIENYLPRDNR